MNKFNKIACDVLRMGGDDLTSQYLRSVFAYAFSISLLFPSPDGGLTPTLGASQIVSAARTIAAAKLFDYRAFSLDGAWQKSTHKIGDVTFPSKLLSSK
jgi:hypothetical protein